MLYTTSDVTGFSGVEGCSGHRERADKSDKHFSIQCPLCEPVLARSRFWKRNPDDVPMTADEQLAAARLERETAANQALMANGLAEAVQRMMATPPAAPARKRAPRKSAKSR